MDEGPGAVLVLVSPDGDVEGEDSSGEVPAVAELLGDSEGWSLGDGEVLGWSLGAGSDGLGGADSAGGAADVLGASGVGSLVGVLVGLEDAPESVDGEDEDEGDGDGSAAVVSTAGLPPALSGVRVPVATAWGVVVPVTTVTTVAPPCRRGTCAALTSGAMTPASRVAVALNEPTGRGSPDTVKSPAA